MPVKRMYKFIYAFLPAFLLALTVAGLPHLDTMRTRQKAKEALSFCRNKGYNTQYCILIDMSLPSGVKRFVVWDFKKNNITLSVWLVTVVASGHGRQPGQKINPNLTMRMAAIVQL
jgi:hypothetical protein